MGSKKTKTTSNETATTTPNVPSWFQQPVENYFGNVVNPLINPNADVLAPINNLQSGAFGMAGSLGSNAGGYQDALGLLGNATDRLSQRVNTQAQTAQLPSLASVPGMLTQQAQMPTAPDVTRVAGPQSIGAVAAPPGVTRVAGPQSVGSVAAPELSQAGMADYGPLSFAQDTSGLAGKDVAQFGGAQASGTMRQYLDPMMAEYVNATLAEFDDQAGRERAAYQAQGARNRSFGGSRFAVGEAQLESDLSRKRALTAGDLRAQAWQQAIAAGAGDAANATQAGIASMNAVNNRDETLASLLADFSRFNAGAANDRSRSMFDAGNELSRFNASEANELASQIFGEGNTNARALFDAQTGNARQDAGAANELASQIFGEGNTNARTLFDAQTGNARQDAGAANELASQIFGTRADMNQFNANSMNEGLRFDIANALSNNQFQAGMQADMGRFNASEANNMAQFNTTANQNNARDLLNAANSRANMAGQMGDDQRANIASMLATGNAQQDAQTQQMLEPFIRAGLLGDLLNPSMAGLFTGQTINSSGTSTSKQSGGLMGGILGSILGGAGSAIGSNLGNKIKF